MIGGTCLVSAVGVIAIILIRGEILRLSGETSPTQVKLAKLERGFERISGSFARISAATSEDDIGAVAADLDRTMSEVEAISSELAHSSSGGGEAEVILKLSETGRVLRQMAAERIQSRQQVAEANRRVGKEIDSVTQSTHTFAESMTAIQQASQRGLEASKKTNLEANSNIKALLVAREKIEQLRSVVQEVRGVDKKFRLNPLRDRARGTLDGLAALELAEKSLAAHLKSFADTFGVMFESDSGLLALRGAVIANAEDAKARLAYDEKHKALIGAIEALSSKFADAIDPLQLAVRKANIGMNEATEQIATVSIVSAAAGEVNARARSLQALAWQLLTVSDAMSVDRIVVEIAGQIKEADRSISDISGSLPKIKQQAASGAVDALRQSFMRVGQTLTGPGGVAGTVRRGLLKHQDADQLFSGALESVHATARAGSARAHDAEGAQDLAVNRIRALSGGTFFATGLAGLAVLLAGALVGRRVRSGILDAEQRQQSAAEEMRIVLDRLQASQERQKILERVREGVETLRATSGELAETSEVVSSNAGSVAEGARNLEQTIRDISTSAVEASRTSAGAAALVSTATGAVIALGDSSKEIGKVTEMIRSIAFETNLLALNAAIQAAHAGEKGAGFAVVARQIKKLAGAASESTSAIDRSIKAMGAHVFKVNQTIVEVARIIDTMRAKQETITAAVQTQTVAAAKIVEGIQQTASGCKGDTQNRGLHAMATQLAWLAEDLSKLCVQSAE